MQLECVLIKSLNCLNIAYIYFLAKIFPESMYLRAMNLFLKMFNYQKALT